MEIVKYSTIIKCEGIKQAIRENPNADQNTLLRRYVSFEPPRVYFKQMTYICSHSTFKWQMATMANGRLSPEHN